MRSNGSVRICRVSNMRSCAPLPSIRTPKCIFAYQIAKKALFACIFSHIYPVVFFSVCAYCGLVFSRRTKVLKFQRFQIYVQSPAFYPIFPFFAFSHYLEFFTRSRLQNLHLVCFYTFRSPSDPFCFRMKTKRHPFLFTGPPEKRKLFGGKEQQRSA